MYAALRPVTPARERAPKHPAGPEAHVRLACVTLHQALAAEIKRLAREHAPMLRVIRTDESPLTSSIAAALTDSGRYLASTLPVQVMRAADATAKSVRDQTRAVTRRASTADLAPIAAEYAGRVVDRMDEDFDETIECSMAMLEQWALDGELDEDDLDQMLDDCSDGKRGMLLAWLFMAFGWMFGQMVREEQKGAGVERAEWVTMRDTHVRPSHRAMDGTVFSWDGPPPLPGALSSSGDDCFPGDDYGCRCLASPVVDVQNAAAEYPTDAAM